MTSQVMTANASRTSFAARVLTRVLDSDAGLEATILRLTAAIVMWPHGAQKLLGWFGGYGFDGTMGYFTKQIGLPAPLAAAAILLEFFGPVLLVLGLGTRLVSAGFIALMLGAIINVHAQNGFFMNWFGAQAGEGFEYHVLAIGLFAALVVRGAGRFGLDGWIARRRDERV